VPDRSWFVASKNSNRIDEGSRASQRIDLGNIEKKSGALTNPAPGTVIRLGDVILERPAVKSVVE
jgi:hypothetical protein